MNTQPTTYPVSDATPALTMLADMFKRHPEVLELVKQQADAEYAQHPCLLAAPKHDTMPRQTTVLSLEAQADAATRKEVARQRAAGIQAAYARDLRLLQVRAQEVGR